MDNDGDLDLFVTKGNVEAMDGYARNDPNELMLGQPDGTFTNATRAAGLTDYGRTRGAAVVDLNLDGLVDLVTVERRENARLWRNVGGGTARRPAPMGGFIALRLRQAGPNPDAIGSRVGVRTPDGTQARELTVGGGHMSGQLGWVTFGLGEAPESEVRIQWPDGEWGPWQPVVPGTWSIIDRGAASPTAWAPPAS